MSDARTIYVDPKDMRLDARLMKRIWRLLTPYWSQRAHWKSWLLLIFGLLIGPAWAYFNFKVAMITAEQANVLVAKDSGRWHALFWLIFLLGVGQWVYGVVFSLLNTLMTMQWWRWMTDWMVERYLRNKTYYDIASKDDIDNPDERIQDNVEPFVSIMLALPTSFLTMILGIATNGLLMTQVTSELTVFVVLYSLGSIVLQAAIQFPLIRKNFDMIAAGADFRFGLLRVRENAETIAFFRGERMEDLQVRSRMHRVIKTRMSVFYYTMFTGIATQLFAYVWTLAPLVFIYPLYFSGKIEFGMIALATAAASGMMIGLTQIQGYLPMLAGIAPRVVRLAQIVERCDEMEAAAARTEERIRVEQGDHIELDNASFQTPRGEQQLAQNVSLRVDPGDSLIIIGPTGVGKSSILRSMAGLWMRGSGTMVMPPSDDTMFVPQRPYMMLGNLRAQLLYPHGREDMSEAEVQAVLERVCLPDLLERTGGLEAECDWSKVLSLGEQQRVSFARVLISKPKFVFLDESTSAVDIPTEALLYQTLIDSELTFVSVGHRETILRFHERALRLTSDGGWELLDADSIEATPIGSLGSARKGENGNVAVLPIVQVSGN